MNKLISLVLSFTLIFGSFTPSFAQLYKVPKNGGKAVKSAEKAAEAAGKQAGKAAAARAGASARVKVKGVVPGGLITTPNVTPSYGQGSVTPSGIVAPTVGVNPQLSATLNRSIDAAQAAAAAVPSKTLKEVNTLLDGKEFSSKDAGDVFKQIFNVQRTVSAHDQLLLNAYTRVTVEKGFATTQKQASLAKETYVRVLRGYHSSSALNRDVTMADIGRLPANSDGLKDLSAWGQAMAAAADLGFYGSAKDASLLLDTYNKTPQALKTFSEVVIGRSLLTLQAYEGLEKLAQLSAINGKLYGDFWAGVSQYVTANNLPVTLPQVTAAQMNSAKLAPNAGTALTYWSKLNARHLDASAKGTADWVALNGKKGQIVADPAAETAAKPAGAATPKVDVKLGDITLPDGLHVAYTPAATEGEAAVAETPAASSNAGTVYSSVVPVSPKWLSKVTSRVRDWFTHDAESAANNTALNILSKEYPLATQLRTILESAAAQKYKEEALVSLYNQGKFNEAISKMPVETQRWIESKKENPEELGKALYHLYASQSLNTAIAAVSDAMAQSSFEKELETIISDPNWEKKVQSAWDNVKVLPLETESFAGIVPSMPDINEKLIVSSCRPTGFASKNRITGKETKKGVFYSNNIPFYYRSASGKLSSAPVGILSQPHASWYSRFLSKFGLSEKPGLVIPKGFVLALDESGQWKYVMPSGNLAAVRANKRSAKLLEEIQANGSVQVPLDTPYNSTDMLAMANMLEKNPGLNLELKLNEPHSLRQFLTLHAYFVGNDAGASLTGPFKSALKSLPGYSGLMSNLVSGIGYFTPLVAAKLMPLMTKIGHKNTIQLIYGGAAAALTFALVGLGMYGTIDVKTLSLLSLSLPTVALVLGASMANTSIQTLLNYYKNPVARTAAHLDFSENKQWSRLALTAATGALASIGLNFTIVVPVGLALLAASEMLFLNTPIYKMGKGVKASGKVAEKAAAKVPEVSKEQLAKEEAEDKALYKQNFRNTRDVKDIASRVKLVYASYAASLMMLSQDANAVLGNDVGQWLVAGFMFATAMTRKFASKQVSSKKMTDDQLTGASLPLLAATAAGIALMPYSGPLALITAGFGIMHYMATAVPGQLDSVRLQNMVSAAMQKEKVAVQENTSLTEAEKEAQLKRIERREKTWGSLAGKDYSVFNSHGLIGILTASAIAFGFADMGPQWAMDLVNQVSALTGNAGEGFTLGMNRIILGYSAVVASILAARNWGLTKDFLGLFRKTKITTETIEAGKVNAGSFGISKKNSYRRLSEVNGTLSKLEKQMVDYGVSSEHKMTDMLKQMTQSYNRLVAIGEVEGNSTVMPALQKLQNIVKSYGVMLEKNHLSVMLNREYKQLSDSLTGIDTTAKDTKLAYVPEGMYNGPVMSEAAKPWYARLMPKKKVKSMDKGRFEDVFVLINELDQLAADIKHGTTSAGTYRLFIQYQNEAKRALQEYAELNPADSPRVLEQTQRLNRICSALKTLDKHHDLLQENAGPTSAADILQLRDVLKGYPDMPVAEH